MNSLLNFLAGVSRRLACALVAGFPQGQVNNGCSCQTKEKEKKKNLKESASIFFGHGLASLAQSPFGRSPNPPQL